VSLCLRVRKNNLQQEPPIMMMLNLENWSSPFCPTAPNWQLNWEEIVNKYPWIANLQDCPQNPIYHAEGDVLIHTRMVCEELISLPAWRNLNTIDRSILFAAALLHDVGKPASTKVDEEGIINSKGHVRLGARMARQILSRLSPNVPFFAKQQIVSLIQYSGLPFWFWDKPNPKKSVIVASQVVRCDLLSLLAEADVRGRECQDKADILERIFLFREYCQENNCFEQPYPFPDNHSRFIYLRSSNSYADYQAYDNTKMEVILMSGLPASGKDTWIANNIPDLPIVSLDRLREAMDVAPTDKQGAIIYAAKDLAKEYLRKSQPFVWNATNINQDMRSSLIDLFVNYHARVKIVYLETDWQELLRRNSEREEPVPDKVIEKMDNKLEIPETIEAREVEWIMS
jgi:putative nucleotidyltransferase with HDIG domain